MSTGTVIPVRVVGGGLTGSTAAWQIANKGVPVVLHEMCPVRPTEAHMGGGLAELGQFAGYAMTCELDWEYYYLAFMRAERTKRRDGEQLAVIDAVFGFVQRRAADSMHDCTAKRRDRVEDELCLRMRAFGR